MAKKGSGPPDRHTPVESLFNLSDKTAGWLRKEGVETYGDLVDSDLVVLWLRLKSQYGQVTRLMYYALWGAVNDCHWKEIPEAEKARIAKIAQSQKT